MFLGASYFRAVGKQQVFGLSARGARHRYRAALGRGVPVLQASSGWCGRRRTRKRDDDLRAARQPEPHGRVSLRRPARRADDGRRRRPALPAPRGEEARHRAAHQHVLPRREQRCASSTTSAPRCTTPTACCSSFATGEWLWRPLDNPRTLQVSAFQMQSPRGFGLLQRDRDFEHYQDLETRPELRPSAWIAPHGDWGDGARRAGRDPDQVRHQRQHRRPTGCRRRHPSPASRASFGYTMYWYGDDPSRPPERPRRSRPGATAARSRTR